MALSHANVFCILYFCVFVFCIFVFLRQTSLITEHRHWARGSALCPLPLFDCPRPPPPSPAKCHLQIAPKQQKNEITEIDWEQ